MNENEGREGGGEAYRVRRKAGFQREEVILKQLDAERLFKGGLKVPCERIYRFEDISSFYLPFPDHIIQHRLS